MEGSKRMLLKVEKMADSPAKPKSSCHHERHMSGVALKVYNLLWRLSKKSKNGAIAITNQRIAKLIGARCEGDKRADYITRAKMALNREGWLEFEGISKGSKTGTWAGGRYLPISHKEWSESKAKKLGHSPCDPPLVIRVSSVHPGGRAFQDKSREARTAKHSEARTAEAQSESHRAGGEARTDRVGGSTSTVRGGKHAQSVDVSTGIRSSSQLTPQVALPPAPPEPSATVLLGSAANAAKGKTPETPEERQKREEREEAEYTKRVAFLKEQAAAMRAKYGTGDNNQPLAAAATG